MVEITRLHRRRRQRRRKTTFRSPPFTRSTAIAKGAPRKSKKPFVISMVKFTYKSTNQLHCIFQIVYCYYLFNPTCFAKPRNLGSAFPVGNFQKNFIV